jgi:hypothetical protein
VNIEGVTTKVDFEFIEIMDESDPYPALFGIDSAFHNNVMLNFKKNQMSFETNTLRVVVPLYPYEGDCYNGLVDEDAWSSIIENIYKATGCREDYINPITNGELRWRSVKYYDMDSKDSMERWKNKIYEVSRHKCVWIMKAV